MKKHGVLVLYVTLGLLMGLCGSNTSMVHGIKVAIAEVVPTATLTDTPTNTPTPTATPIITSSSTQTPTVTLTPTVEATLCPGECIEETKEIFIPPAPGKADVLFAFDSSGSMVSVINSAKANAVTIMDNLISLISDVQFGVLDFCDYPLEPYGGSEDSPYRLWQSITSNETAVQNAINAIPVGGGRDGPESYTRALYESYTDTSIGWRWGARKFMLAFGDSLSHDEDLNAGVPEPQPYKPGEVWCTGYAPSYLDPGRDGTPGTDDDLDFQTVLSGMNSNQVTLLHVVSECGTDDCSEGLTTEKLATYWQNWAGRTGAGGDAVKLDEVGDLPAVIQSLVTGASRHISLFTLQADPPSYQSWLTVYPPAYTDLTVPPEGLTVTFDVLICVPSETPSGTYSFSINAVGDGAIYDGQGVTVWVPSWCEPTPTNTPTPTYTPTPTPTHTPTSTPTATPTPMPVEECYCCSPGDSIYRIDGSDFYGYQTDSASDSALIRVTSPPAPPGWNQPDFQPDSSWQPGSEVWWPFWAAPLWAPLPGDCRPIGLRDEDGNPEGRDETTYLYRRTFTLSPPEEGMRIAQAVLEMWSDNKTEWWWQGSSVSNDGKEGYIGQVDLFPGHARPHGGSYVLAIQNSNDRVSRDNNPQGTACRLCITWAIPSEPDYQVYLPLILKAHP